MQKEKCVPNTNVDNFSGKLRSIKRGVTGLDASAMKVADDGVQRFGTFVILGSFYS